MFAQHPVELKGKFTTNLSEAGEAIHALEQHGIEANFQVTNFHVEGSPLLEELGVNMKEGLLTLSPNRKKGALQFEFNDEIDRPRVIQVDGVWKLGQTSSTFEGQLESSPFYCESRLFPAEFIQGKDAGLTMMFKWDAWTGKQLMSPPGFDDILELVDAFKQRRLLQIHWLIEGQHICSAQQAGDESATDALPTLRWISACREVARRLKVFPEFPRQREITEDMWEGVGVLQTLLAGESISSPCPGMRLTFPATSTPENQVLPKEKEEPSDLTLIGFHEWEFLGTKFELRMKNVFTAMHLERVPISGDAIEMHFAGTNSTIRKLAFEKDEDGQVVIVKRLLLSDSEETTA